MKISDFHVMTLRDVMRFNDFHIIVSGQGAFVVGEMMLS